MSTLITPHYYFLSGLFSSIAFVHEQPKLIKSVAIGGEALYGGEIDYLWLRIFSRLNAGAKKPQENTNQFRKKIKYKSTDFTAHTSIYKATYLARKLNICVLQAKDPIYIRRVEASKNGVYKVYMKRCEKYSETKRLSRYWRRYLEDVKLTFEVNTNANYNFNYLLDFYGLRLFNIDNY